MAKKGGNNLNIVLGVDIAGLKKGFDDAVKVTQKAGGDVEKSAKAVSDSVQNAFKKIENSSSLKQASRQMFNLAASLQAGGTATEKAFRQAIREAGHLQDEIQDLNALIQVGGPAGPFIAMNNALKLGVAGMNAVQGSMALIGVESEDLQRTMVRLQAGMALAGALKELEGVKDVFGQLNHVMKMNPALTVAAGMTALVATIAAVHDSTRKLTDTQQAGYEVQKKAIETYADEEANLKALYKELNTGNISRGEQQKIIDNFNTEHPKLLQGLRTEGMNISDINGALIARIALIRKEAEAQAARTLYIEEYTKMLKASQEAKELAAAGPSAFDKFLTSFGGVYGSILTDQTQVGVKIYEADKRANVFYETWQNINTEVKALKEQLRGLYNTDFSSPSKASGAPAPAAAAPIDYNAILDESEGMKYVRSLQGKIIKELSVAGQTAQGIQVAIPPAQFKMSKDAMEDYMKMLRQVTIESQALGNVIRDSISSGLSNMASAMGEAIATGQNLGMVIGKSLLAAMANFMRALGEMFVKTGVAKLAFDEAIIKIGGAPLAIAAGFALIAGSAAMTAKLQQKNQPRAFADGGVIYGPTLGLMGEYAGASANPEIVAPLDKLKSLIQPSTGNMIAETRIDGRDLVILVKNTERDMSRG